VFYTSSSERIDRNDEIAGATGAGGSHDRSQRSER
jgi:hypothetical protein